MDDPNKVFLVKTDRGEPLYQQLYTNLRAAILSCELKSGMKLPSTRALASELNVSRNTVLNAYRQLLAEGYLVSIAGSGTYVAGDLPEAMLFPSTKEVHDVERNDKAHQLRLSEIARSQTTVSQLTAVSLAPGSRTPRPFSPEMPALDAFPYELWTRIVTRQARRLPRSSFAYQDWAGFYPLREAISAYLAISRQVHCTPEQIIIVSGSQGALNLAAHLLVNAGEPVWMEDPGYHGARGAFLGAGAQIIPIPVDDEGLVVDAGIARAPQARLVYLTPSHQFPLGVTMSLARRLALLDWAKQVGAYLVEDDYDSEYRFAGRPFAALHGLDDAERVIYIGTFSKVLFPALRLGYLVLPPSLVEAFLAVRRFIDIHSPMLEQVVLTEFMAAGHFTRHLRRMRTLYAERRAALLDVAAELPLEIRSPEAGIHCVAWLPDEVDSESLLHAAANHGLDLSPLSNYSIEPLARQGLLLGYGGYSVQEIESGIRRLAAVMRSV
jgi:GntR family transcriptional regulator/MocR family aminotransferase